MTFPAPLIQTLRSARRVTVLTGAGVSAESGVPTFRDAQTGLWAKYSPQDLATPEAFRRDPRLVWEWYQWRGELVSRARPNPGHLALADWAQRLAQQGRALTLITQNVDGLHQQAGSPEVIELHGNIHRTKCFDEGRIVEGWEPTDEPPPRCPYCGGYLRPDVVWFNESLPTQALEDAFAASQNCDLFLSVGTSGLVQPAASLAYHALDAGAVVVEVNPERTPLTEHAAHFLQGPSGEILPALVRAACSDS